MVPCTRCSVPWRAGGAAQHMPIHMECCLQRLHHADLTRWSLPHPPQGKHVIHYDDNEVETLDMAEQRWRPLGSHVSPAKPPRSEPAPAAAVPLPSRSRLHRQQQRQKQRQQQHAGSGKQSMSAARTRACSPAAGGGSGTDSLEDDSSSDDCAAHKVAASKHVRASAPRAAGVLQPLQLMHPGGPATSATCNGTTAPAPAPSSRPSPEPEVPAAAAAQRAVMMDTQGAAELLTGLRCTRGAAAAADVTLPAGKPSPPASSLPAGMATPQQGASGGCGASRAPPRTWGPGDPLGRNQLDSVPEVVAAGAAAPAAGELPNPGHGAGPAALQRTPAAGDAPPPRC